MISAHLSAQRPTNATRADPSTRNATCGVHRPEPERACYNVQIRFKSVGFILGVRKQRRKNFPREIENIAWIQSQNDPRLGMIDECIRSCATSRI